MKRNLFLICGAVTLAACSPTPSSTQAGQEIVESASKTPTETLTATMVPPTSTPTPTVTPTPDLRLILEDPRACVGLDEIDMLANFDYWEREEEWNSLLCGSYKADGPEYIENTGRITGWHVYYQGSSRDATEPYQVYCSVELFDSFAGPDIARNMKNVTGTAWKRYKYEEIPLQILFDEPVAYFVFRGFKGDVNNYPLLDFDYRNVSITIGLMYMRPQDIMPEQYAPYLEVIGNRVLRNLQEAPLAE